jgi:hypothetical protein
MKIDDSGMYKVIRGTNKPSSSKPSADKPSSKKTSASKPSSKKK